MVSSLVTREMPLQRLIDSNVSQITRSRTRLTNEAAGAAAHLHKECEPLAIRAFRPVLRLMHWPDASPDGGPLPADEQDKRTELPLESDEWSTWPQETPAPPLLLSICRRTTSTRTAQQTPRTRPHS